jgi:hypothetical protein
MGTGVTMLKPRPLSAADAVAAYDRGESLNTIEMGGIGPGYEQAIQVGAIELIRVMLNRPLPDPPPKDWGHKELCEIDDRIDLGGLTGAMGGAIMSLAYGALKHGWSGRNFRFLKASRKNAERMIMFSKTWPGHKS